MQVEGGRVHGARRGTLAPPATCSRWCCVRCATFGQATDSGAWYMGRSWIMRGTVIMNNVFERVATTEVVTLGYPIVRTRPSPLAWHLNLWCTVGVNVLFSLPAAVPRRLTPPPHTLRAGERCVLGRRAVGDHDSKQLLCVARLPSPCSMCGWVCDCMCTACMFFAQVVQGVWGRLAVGLLGLCVHRITLVLQRLAFGCRDCACVCGALQSLTASRGCWSEVAGTTLWCTTPSPVVTPESSLTTVVWGGRRRSARTTRRTLASWCRCVRRFAGPWLLGRRTSFS